MGRRPLIGVSPSWHAGDKLIQLIPTYMEALIRGGALPVLPPFGDYPELLDDFIERCDGIMMTGGEDLDPAFYGAERHEACGPTVPERDAFDRYFYLRALEMNKPVLGICRGLQLMNCASGGSLYQDIPSELTTDIAHRMERPFTRTVHAAEIVKGSPLHALLKEDRIQVNSIHHQCVRDLAPGFEVMATAPDGVVEAIWHPGYKFVCAVQWHPERLLDVTPESVMLFREFTEVCAGKKTV